MSDPGAIVAVGQPTAEAKGQSSTPHQKPLKSVPDPAGQVSQNSTVAATPATSTEERERFLEPHHTIKELAERWNLDRETVRRLVCDRDDVLKIAHVRRNAKRDYVSYRVPQSVARTIYNRLLGRSK
jgi:hypothetical protein